MREDRDGGTNRGGVIPVESWMLASSIPRKRRYIRDRWGEEAKVNILCFYVRESFHSLGEVDRQETERQCFMTPSPKGCVRLIKSSHLPGWILRVDDPGRVVYDLRLRGEHRPLAIVEFAQSVVVRKVMRGGMPFQEHDRLADFTQL
ncbi:MAG: hypothetical protein Q8R07_04015 [Candidatus Uhrbacteria bacterium]|nr:hypothetical protein [Candidatus Uhrbacteria bacterium]